MIRRILSPLAGLLLLSTCCGSLFAQQFSAVLVRQKPAGAVSSKVFVRDDKIRFEAGTPQASSVVIEDLKQGTGFIIIPANKSYTEYAPGRIPSAMPFFRPADPEQGCPAWEKLVNKPGSCAKLGDDTINGRDAVKYRGIASNGDTGVVWVDRKLKFVVKWEGRAAAAELQNIKESPQALSLFEIPKGYDKTDSQAAHQAARQKSKGLRLPPKPKN